MVIKTWQLGVIVLVVILGGIALASVLGLWKTAGGQGRGRHGQGEHDESAQTAVIPGEPSRALEAWDTGL